MADIYASFPPTVGPTHVPVYANFAAFPSAASAGVGAEGFALDSSTLYVSDGSAWQAVGGAGSIGIGTFDSGVASAQGAHVDAGSLIMQSASATVPGLVNTSTQTLAGAKTLSSAPVLSSLTASRALTVDASKVVTVSTTTDTELGYVSGVTSAIQTQLNAKQGTLTPGSISTSTTGVSVGSGAASTVGPNVTVNVQTASGSQPGLLSSADWTTFNNKQSALTTGNLTDVGTDGIVVTGGTGAVIGAGTSLAQHVADVSHNGYLSSTDWATFNGKQASGNYITALTGDVTASGPGSVASTVAKIAGTTVSGTTGTGNVVFSTSPALTTPDLGTPSAGVLTSCSGLPLTSGVTGTLPILNGGTGRTTATTAFNALSPMTTLGDIIVGGASGAGTRLAGDTSNTKKFLTSTSAAGVSAAPIWDTILGADVPLATTALQGTVPFYGSTSGAVAVDASAGSWSSPPTCTVRCVRVGDMVVLKLDTQTTLTTHSSTAGTYRLSTIVPANYRPAQDIYIETYGIVNGGSAAVVLQVATNGTMAFYADSALSLFSTQSFKFNATSVSYTIT